MFETTNQVDHGSGPGLASWVVINPATRLQFRDPITWETSQVVPWGNPKPVTSSSGRILAVGFSRQRFVDGAKLETHPVEELGSAKTSAGEQPGATWIISSCVRLAPFQPVSEGMYTLEGTSGEFDVGGKVKFVINITIASMVHVTIGNKVSNGEISLLSLLLWASDQEISTTWVRITSVTGNHSAHNNPQTGVFLSRCVATLSHHGGHRVNSPL